MGANGQAGEGVTVKRAGFPGWVFPLGTIRTILLNDAKRGLFDRLRSVTWAYGQQPYKLGQARREAFEDYRLRAEQIVQLLLRNGRCEMMETHHEDAKLRATRAALAVAVEALRKIEDESALIGPSKESEIAHTALCYLDALDAGETP